MDLFENVSERTIFMAMNLIRSNPKWAIPYIMDLQHHKRYTGANIGLAI